MKYILNLRLTKLKIPVVEFSFGMGLKVLLATLFLLRNLINKNVVRFRSTYGLVWVCLSTFEENWMLYPVIILPFNKNY